MIYSSLPTQLPTGPGVDNESREIADDPKPEIGVSGICIGLQTNENLPNRGKEQKDNAGGTLSNRPTPSQLDREWQF